MNHHLPRVVTTHHAGAVLETSLVVSPQAAREIAEALRFHLDGDEPIRSVAGELEQLVQLLDQA